MKKILFLGIITFSLACEPKLDGTDIVAFKESRQKVENSLPEIKKNRFSYFINEKHNINFFTLDANLKALDNKSYNDLNDIYGEDLDKESNQKIAKLNEEIEKILLSKSKVDSIEISNAKAFSNQSMFGFNNGFKFKVKNNLSEGLKKIYCNVYFNEKQSGDTLLQGNFNYLFDIPLRGEQDLNLTTSIFSDLDNKMNPKLISVCDFSIVTTGVLTKSFDYSSYDAKELIKKKDERKKYRSYIE